MTRSWTITLISALALAQGCFTGDGLFGPREPLIDEYMGLQHVIRGDYALGAPVTFTADLEDGMSGVVDIEVPEGFRVIERGALFVSTIAQTESTGQVRITLDGDELGRYDTRIAAVDRIAFRRTFDVFGREDYTETRIFHSSATAAVVVDFYAADGTRLFGRAITSVPEAAAWTTVTTSNNDRVVLNTTAAGLYEIPVSVNDRSLDTVSFERVTWVATFRIELLEEDGTRWAVPIARDVAGRSVIVAPDWTLDGRSEGPLERLGLDSDRHEVTAELDGMTRTLSVPAG